MCRQVARKVVPFRANVVPIGQRILGAKQTQKGRQEIGRHRDAMDDQDRNKGGGRLRSIKRLQEQEQQEEEEEEEDLEQ